MKRRPVPWPVPASGAVGEPRRKQQGISVSVMILTASSLCEQAVA